MPKTIIIFCRYFDDNKSPFNTEYYYNAYQDLLLALKERGANAYFATDMATYKGNGVFAKAYATDHKAKASEYQIVTDVAADVVYDKGGFAATDVTVLNPPFVHSITSSKAETYRHFAAYQPTSFVCSDDHELAQALDSLAGTLAVIKVPTGNGGHGVHIASKDELLASLPDTYPVVAQEFLDTSCGIDGFVQGIHDLRIKIGGGKIWGGTLRTPAPGEYRANVAQGGTEKWLLPDEIPEAAKEIAFEIDRYFAAYPRYFAVDVANTPQGWKLIELNSKPGLSPVDKDPRAKLITDTLADYLVQLAR